MKIFRILFLLFALLVCISSSHEVKTSRKAGSRNVRERGIHQSSKTRKSATLIHAKAAAVINDKAPQTSSESIQEPASAGNWPPYSVDEERHRPGSASVEGKGPSAEASGHSVNEPWYSPEKSPSSSGGFAAEKENDPNLEKKANMVRFLVHHSNSVVLASRPARPGFIQYTDANIQLLVDTIDGTSTGKPYLYIHRKDLSILDIHFDHHASILLTRAAVDDFCKSLPLMVKDVACSRALLQGRVWPMYNETTAAEAKAVYLSFIDKYPALKNEDPKDYIMGYMNIEAIWVHGDDGDPEKIPLDIYNKANPDSGDGDTETISSATRPAN